MGGLGFGGRGLTWGVFKIIEWILMPAGPWKSLQDGQRTWFFRLHHQFSILLAASLYCPLGSLWPIQPHLLWKASLLPARNPATHCSPSLLQLSWDAALPEPRPPCSPPGRWAFLQGLAVGCTFPSLEMTSGGNGEG